jgi:hypothetical protein
MLKSPLLTKLLLERMAGQAGWKLDSGVSYLARERVVQHLSRSQRIEGQATVQVHVLVANYG